MKETVVDLLIYLYENYLDVEAASPVADRTSLQEELEEAGFSNEEIDRALLWLEELSQQRLEAPHAQGMVRSSLRVLAPQESERMELDAQGFLMSLEHNGVLDSAARELVLERVMALDESEIDVEQLQWIVLLVLFGRPGHEAAFAWVEDMVYEGAPLYRH